MKCTNDIEKFISRRILIAESYRYIERNIEKMIHRSCHDNLSVTFKFKI